MRALERADIASRSALTLTEVLTPGMLTRAAALPAQRLGAKFSSGVVAAGWTRGTVPSKAPEWPAYTPSAYVSSACSVRISPSALQPR